MEMKRSWWKTVAKNIALLVFVYGAAQIYQTHGLLDEGTEVPSFQLQSLTGGLVDSQSLKGKGSLIYVFAPWCGVCEMTTSSLVRVREWLPEDSYQVLALGMSYRSHQELERYAQEGNLNVPVLLGNDRLLEELKVEAFPTFYFVSEDGTIAGQSVGYTSAISLWLRSLALL